jgi:hypothetical protein
MHSPSVVATAEGAAVAEEAAAVMVVQVARSVAAGVRAGRLVAVVVQVGPLVAVVAVWVVRSAAVAKFARSVGVAARCPLSARPNRLVDLWDKSDLRKVTVVARFEVSHRGGRLEPTISGKTSAAGEKRSVRLIVARNCGHPIRRALVDVSRPVTPAVDHRHPSVCTQRDGPQGIRLAISSRCDAMLHLGESAMRLAVVMLI